MRVGGQEEGMEEAGWEGKFSSYTFLFCFDLLKIFGWKSFFFFNLFTYLFLSALGLCCCKDGLSRGHALVVVRRLLTAVASLVAEHRLQSVCSAVVAQGLSCSMACGTLP